MSHVSPSGLAVAWSDARMSVSREDVGNDVFGGGLSNEAATATLRELLAAVCESGFAGATLDAAREPTRSSGGMTATHWWPQ